MTTSTTATQHSKPSHRVLPETHVFSAGQSVRLKNAILLTGTVYRITANLPPNGASRQYRIRNENEKFERMASETDLELVSAAEVSTADASAERLFGSHQTA